MENLNSIKNLLITFVFLGFAITFLMKESSRITSTDYLEQALELDKNTVAAASALYFLGYIMSQLFGSFLARRLDGSLVFVLGVLGSSIITLVFPSVARGGELVLMALRFSQGVFEGFLYPSFQEICSYWASVNERSRLIAYGLSGSYFGTFLSIILKSHRKPISEVEENFDATGSIGVIYCGVFLLSIFLVYRKLPKHYHRRRLVAKVFPQEKPFENLIRTIPVWAIACAHSVTNFGYSILKINLFVVLDPIGHPHNHTETFVSWLYLAINFTIIFAGTLSDSLVNLKNLPKITVRKCFIGFGSIMQAIFLVCLASGGFSGGVVLVFVTLAMGCNTFTRIGVYTNMLDSAPQFASIVMAISNSCAAVVPGLLVCITTITSLDDNVDGLMWTTVVLNIFGMIIYSLYATDEKFSWILSREPF